MFNISLDPDDNFLLSGPSGRTVTISPTAHGALTLQRILFSYQYHISESRQAPTFPSQHIVDKWIKEARGKQIETARAKLENDLGITLDELDFDL